MQKPAPEAARTRVFAIASSGDRPLEVAHEPGKVSPSLPARLKPLGIARQVLFLMSGKQVDRPDHRCLPGTVGSCGMQPPRASVGCAVSAVIADRPCTPNAAKVCKSAWTPAPRRNRCRQWSAHKAVLLCSSDGWFQVGRAMLRLARTTCGNRRDLAQAALPSAAARIPCSKAVGVGGQPRIVTSTGITLATWPRLA